MRPLYHRYRRRAEAPADRDTDDRREPPTAWACRFAQTAPRAEDGSPGSDDRSPSPRVREAAARLRTGERDPGRIADLTGVPAALVELMRDVSAAGASPPSRRPVVTAAVLSAGAIGCSLGALSDGQMMVAQLGAVAAILPLLVAQLGRRDDRPPRQR